MQLGVVHQRIPPSSPQENSQHERIGDRTSSSLWTPPTRAYPEQVTPPDYPAHLEVRRISTAGDVPVARAAALSQ